MVYTARGKVRVKSSGINGIMELPFFKSSAPKNIMSCMKKLIKRIMILLDPFA